MSFNRLEKWLANYKNETPESKDVMARTKDTYKGDAYLPWANMLGILYRLDPDAIVEKVMNANGGYVFTDKNMLDVFTMMSKESKEDIKHNTQAFMGHMVKVRVTYFGKVYEEVYPIQDNKYEAVIKFDSNMINKALQRCMARTISLATGIGWSLYEQGEAGQFEEDGVLKFVQTTSVETEKIEVGTVLEGQALGQAITELDVIVKLIEDNRENTGLATLFENYNTVFRSKYKVNGEPMEIDILNDTNEILTTKLSVVANLDKVLKGVSKVVK